MAKITKVPNGPLIKKKGPFKGSTLKSGGPVKKKQGGGFGNIMGMVGGLMGGGGSKKDDSKKEDPLEATKNKFENSKNLLGNSLNKVNRQLVANQAPDVRKSLLKAGGKVKKAKAGGMIKRADGSYSKRGLWDNIRANKGSGKKPTKQMLVQEKKIKAKTKK